MPQLVSPRREEAVVVKSFLISMMVQCPCGAHLLLSFIPGMGLATTCQCKRKVALRGIEIDPNTQAVGTAIVVDSSATLTPSREDLEPLIKVN